MTPYKWITETQVISLHRSMIERFGGGEGIRDSELLQSALANPQNLFHYQGANVFECAAAYAQAIALNHAFIDANKRTGLGVAMIFLSVNGYIFKPQEDKNHENIMVDLAEKKISLEDFAEYFKNQSIK